MLYFYQNIHREKKFYIKILKKTINDLTDKLNHKNITRLRTRGKKLNLTYDEKISNSHQRFIKQNKGRNFSIDMIPALIRIKEWIRKSPTKEYLEKIDSQKNYNNTIQISDIYYKKPDLQTNTYIYKVHLPTKNFNKIRPDQINFHINKPQENIPNFQEINKTNLVEKITEEISPIINTKKSNEYKEIKEKTDNNSSNKCPTNMIEPQTENIQKGISLEECRKAVTNLQFRYKTEDLSEENEYQNTDQIPQNNENNKNNLEANINQNRKKLNQSLPPKKKSFNEDTDLVIIDSEISNKNTPRIIISPPEPDPIPDKYPNKKHRKLIKLRKICKYTNRHSPFSEVLDNSISEYLGNSTAPGYSTKAKESIILPKDNLSEIISQKEKKPKIVENVLSLSGSLKLEESLDKLKQNEKVKSICQAKLQKKI